MMKITLAGLSCWCFFIFIWVRIFEVVEMIKKIAFLPHPPIVIPEVGGRDAEIVKETFEKMDLVAKEFADQGINKVLIISPHGVVDGRNLVVNLAQPLEGNLGNFGYFKSYQFKNSLELAMNLAANGFVPVESRLDHGVMVPLYFFARHFENLEVLSLSTGYWDEEELAHRGAYLAKLLNEDPDFAKDKWGIIVSSDLSHKLTEDGPYGFAKEGPVFDRMVYEIIESGDLGQIKKIPYHIVDGAAQCGYIPLAFAGEILKNCRLEAEVLSYEGTFGVGYLVGKGDVSC